MLQEYWKLIDYANFDKVAQLTKSSNVAGFLHTMDHMLQKE